MNYQCVKSVQIRSFFWSVFSCIRTEYRDLLRIQSDTGKYGSEKTLFLDTFHAVFWIPEWGGPMNSCLPVRPSVRRQPTILRIFPLVFSEVLYRDRNLET